MTTSRSAQEEERASIDEYHRLEIEEIFERIRALTNQRLQLLALLGGANLAILSIAGSTRKAGLFLVAATTIPFLMLADAIARQSESVTFCRGLQLEKRYAPDARTAFLHTHVATTTSRRKRLQEFCRIADLDNQEERVRELRRYRYSTTGTLLPLVVLSVEVALALITWLLLDWSPF